MKNREIKFRGLRTDGKGWVYGVPFPNKEEEVCFIINNMKTLNFTTDDTEFDGHGVIPSTVGQYTGLKDKNGKEIYEGDVVISEFDSYRYNKNVMKKTMVVKHDTVNPCFVLIDVYDPNITEYDFVQCGMRTNEVIGNIHENPELLTI